MQQTTAMPIAKVETGIAGLDEVLYGGLPKHRTTLIKGSAGSGKTVLGLEFLVHSARQGESVIMVTFEETAEAIRQNALALGWDLEKLEKEGTFFLWEAKFDHQAIISGDFNIESLLAGIKGKAEKMGATLIMIDAIDILLRLFDDPRRERNELYRLHDWLIEQAFTTIFTAKLTHHPDHTYCYEFLDYLTDCLIHLDLRLVNQVMTRRLRVIKYRGSGFLSNEYPYIITEAGNLIMPVSTVEIEDSVYGKFISSGNDDLNRQLGGGYHRGSSIFISGPSGSGKTTLAATFAQKACANGEKVLYISFEESAQAIVSAMLSPGIDLRDAVETGSLKFYIVMPEALVFEEHLYRILQQIEQFQPRHVVMDAVSACKRMGTSEAAFDFLVRFIHVCKNRGLTCLMTHQLNGHADIIRSEMGVSSIVDTWIGLRYIEKPDYMDRELLIIKSRGSHHSNKRHRYLITETGIQFNPKDTSGRATK